MGIPARFLRRATLAGLLAAAPLLPAAAGAATYVLPHWIETSGSTATSTYAFDDFVYLRYLPGLAGSASGPGATVDLYLYDNAAGAPLTIFGTQVCAPCTFNVGGPAPRQVTANIGDLISTRAGFGAPAYVGYAVLVVRGADPAGVTIESDLVNSHSDPFDLDVASTAPLRLRGEDPALPSASVYAIPHMLDTAGSTSTTAYTFDETLFATDTGGQAGTAGGAGATVALYLYDETTGTPLTNYGAVVCAPCTYAIGGGAPRKLTIRMEDLVLAKGGAFDALAKRATGVVVVSGTDKGSVTLQPWLVNSHSNALDLGMTPQVAQPVWTTGLLGVIGDDTPGALRALSVAPNPAPGAVQLGFDLAAPGAVHAAVYDVAGREIAPLTEGRLAAGHHELTWDGHDATGRRVTGGIYFVRVTGADRSAGSRVVMLP